MAPVKLNLGYAVLGLFAYSLAFGEQPQDSSSHQHDGSSQGPEPSVPPAAVSDAEDTSSEAAHVPPDPPQHPMGDMPYPAMAAMMQMDDAAPVGKALFDQLEWRNTAEGNAAVWDAQAWYGGDYNKVWLKTEGARVDSTTQGAHADLLWDRNVSRWWSAQAGARRDFGEGPSRTWAALGVQGLAPYWFGTEATFYVGEQGRTAMRLKTEYELLVRQRLILQPEGEANLYGKADPARQLGSGLSDLELALRLRYEVRRELAPYIGVVWSLRFGGTADRVRESGGDVSDMQFVAGLRAWF
ncbi:MAG: copper resistance protein B [Steroidobacteraceae bacterium]